MQRCTTRCVAAVAIVAPTPLPADLRADLYIGLLQDQVEQRYYVYYVALAAHASSRPADWLGS